MHYHVSDHSPCRTQQKAKASPAKVLSSFPSSNDTDPKVCSLRPERCLTARKTYVLTASRAARVKKPRPLLLRLPVEVVIMIVEAILNDIVDHLIEDLPQRPITIFGQYRALLLVCKTFKSIVTQTRIIVSITEDRRYGMAAWHGDGEFEEPVHRTQKPTINYFRYGYNLQYHEYEDSTEYYSVGPFLWSWQQLYVRYLNIKDFSKVIKDVGKFYLSPTFTSHELSELLCRNTVEDKPTLLLRLGQLLESKKQRATSIERIQYNYWFTNSRAANTVNTEGNVSNIKGRDVTMNSVGNWSRKDDLNVSGSKVATEVREWWMWGEMIEGHRAVNPELFFSGYVGAKAWVMDVNRKTVHKNFGRGRRSKRIGRREPRPRAHSEHLCGA